MTGPNIERMRLIVTIDDRITNVQEGLVTLAESFEKSAENPNSSINLEDLNAGLDQIIATTAELIILVTPQAALETAETSAQSPAKRRKNGKKYLLDGEMLTFNEICERHPHLNQNTLRSRLTPGSPYTVHEAVYGRAKLESTAPSAANGESPPAAGFEGGA